MEESDSTVIAKSVEDPGSFAVIFDRYASVLLRFLARRVDPGDADALLGDVFRIAFERRGSYDLDREHAVPWLYGIASNVVSRHRRSEARRLRATVRAASRSQPGEDPAERAVEAFDASSNWRRVAQALTSLSTVERDALLLYVWEELSYEEIATIQGVPMGTVRSRLNRARRHLRASAWPGSSQRPAVALNTREDCAL